MNPYEILGLPSNATVAEIKSAYRRLAKKYHPDANKANGDVSRIAQLNEAYDILTNPAKKAAFDFPSAPSLHEYEEDPREVYRREYIKRKREESLRRMQRKVRIETTIYKIVRIITFPILVSAILLVLDYNLPHDTYNEVAEVGWQKRTGGGRHSSAELISYMQTEHFTIIVPDEVHVNYDYYATKKEVLTIEATPILMIPTTASINFNTGYISFGIVGTVYAFGAILPYLLLASAMLIIAWKEYSKLRYSLCFLPLMFLAIILMILL